MKRFISLIVALGCFLAVLGFSSVPQADAAVVSSTVHLDDLAKMDGGSVFTMDQLLALLQEAYDLGYEDGKRAGTTFAPTTDSSRSAIAAALLPPTPSPSASAVTYILNTNSRKFHSPNCRSVEQIAPKNYAEFYGTREEAIAQGYSPCKSCNP